MPAWDAFVGLTGVVLLFLLALSRASQRLVTDGPADTVPLEGIGRDPALPDPEELRRRGDAPAPEDGAVATDPGERENREAPDGDSPGSDRTAPVVHTLEDAGAPPTSTAALVANVTVSQGLFGTLLVGGALFAAIPPSALGLDGAWTDATAVGVALGVGLYLANELGAAAADRLGIDHSERLRELLAPDSPAGWALLLLVALPVIAGFEELLFRAALVGVVSTAYPVSPWLMVGLSSVAFGLGHGAQGTGGIAVTAGLGAVLGAAYVLTGSLVTVFVAHYLINALEFLVHEWTGIEWAG